MRRRSIYTRTEVTPGVMQEILAVRVVEVVERIRGYIGVIVALLNLLGFPLYGVTCMFDGEYVEDMTDKM